MTLTVSRRFLSLILGAAAAPIVGAVVAIPVWFAIAAVLDHGQSMAAAIMFGFMLALSVGGLLGWPAMILVGLPFHAALVAFGFREAWHYCLTGAVAGMGVGATLLILLSDAPAEATNLFASLGLGAFTGAVTAYAFWFVRRPDLDAANLARPAP